MIKVKNGREVIFLLKKECISLGNFFGVSLWKLCKLNYVFIVHFLIAFSKVDKLFQVSFGKSYLHCWVSRSARLSINSRVFDIGKFFPKILVFKKIGIQSQLL